MGVIKTKGSVCPMDEDSIFVIRKHGSLPTPKKKGSLSRQTSINSFQSRASKLTLDEDLETLRAANIIFVRQVQHESEKDTNSPNKYIIVTTCGDLLFCALETTDAKTLKSFEEDKPFKFSILNTQGEEVFDINGHPGSNGLGAYVTVRRETLVLGNIAQINKALSPWSWCRCLSKVKLRRKAPTYLVEAPDGRTVQKILRQDTWKNCFGLFSGNDFNVYSPDGSICKAKISRQTDSITLEEYTQADTYALSFHTTEMDGKLKALLIAAVLMLDFQFFEKKVSRDYKSLILRTLVCSTFIILLVGMIILVTNNAIDFENQKASRFPGKIAN